MNLQLAKEHTFNLAKLAGYNGANPTLALLQKWLREAKNIVVEAAYNPIYNYYEAYVFSSERASEKSWLPSNSYTYECVLEAAIVEALSDYIIDHKVGNQTNYL